MDNRFTNNYLAQNVNKLLAEDPKIEPAEGTIGGYSIEFSTNDDAQSFESILYKDEVSRNSDLELLKTLLENE